MDNCIFCKIIKREIPSEIVYEDEKIFAFKDINPVAPVHVLIIPKVHVKNIMEINDQNADILKDIHLAAKKIALKVGLGGFRLINNCGEEAGQTVFHLHYHLIGGKELGPNII